MPVTINDVVVMTDDGKLTSDFKPEMLGEEYKDSKVFTKTPDILTLMKVTADSKAALGKKLENVIQKPGEKATDEEKAEYKNQLYAEVGVPDSPDKYKFSVEEKEDHDKELVATVKKLFHAGKVPADTAEAIVNGWDEMIRQRDEAAAIQLDTQYNTEMDAYKKARPGDKLSMSVKTALKAMVQFGSEELAKTVKDSGLLTDASNLDKLKELNLWPGQLATWEKVGAAMKSDDAITDDGGIVGGEPTIDDTIAGVYNHPTSVADRKARGKAK